MLKKLKYMKISMGEVPKLLEGIYNDPELRSTCIPLLLGNPGIAKTKMVEQFAKEKGVNLVSIIASQLLPHEVSGLALPDKKNKLMTYFDYDRLAKLKDEDVVMLDELGNCNINVLNALLTLLENRTLISGRKLPNVMFVAAANPQFSNPMSPQIKERFIWYDVEFDPKLWGKYMYKKYDLIDPILDQLVELIKNESFTSANKNYYTPRSIDKAINMTLKGVKSPYENVVQCLQHYITNTTDQDISIGDYIWKVNEKITWLKLKQLENDKVNTKS